MYLIDIIEYNYHAQKMGNLSQAQQWRGTQRYAPK